jgi:hypothetical protein
MTNSWKTIICALAFLFTSIGSACARADGGRLCVNEQAGPWQVAVFTSPTPLHSGIVDVSILVQETATGQVARDIAVTVDACHMATGTLVHARATTADATNKLLLSAPCRCDESGPWHVTVSVADPRNESQRVEFDVTLSHGVGRSPELVYWIGWPLAPIALFVAHRCLVRRKERAVALSKP